MVMYLKMVSSLHMLKHNFGETIVSSLKGVNRAIILMYQTGCRMSALATTGNIDGKDPLMLGTEHITKHIKAIADKSHREIMDNPNSLIYPNPSLRFREEDGFGLINIRWGNTIEVETNLFNAIKNSHKESSPLTVKELLETCSDKNYLASLISKEVIAPNIEDFSKKKSHRGVSTDPAKLPAESFILD